MWPRMTSAKTGQLNKTMAYDALGNITYKSDVGYAVISDDSGAVLASNGRLSYDAWGRRRFANGTDDPGVSDSPAPFRICLDSQVLA